MKRALTLATAIARAGSLGATKAQSTIKITAGGKPLLEHRFAEVPFKPYAAQIEKLYQRWKQ
jgi:hypothetical protein